MRTRIFALAILGLVGAVGGLVPSAAMADGVTFGFRFGDGPGYGPGPWHDGPWHDGPWHHRHWRHDYNDEGYYAPPPPPVQRQVCRTVWQEQNIYRYGQLVEVRRVPTQRCSWVNNGW